MAWNICDDEALANLTINFRTQIKVGVRYHGVVPERLLSVKNDVRCFYSKIIRLLAEKDVRHSKYFSFQIEQNAHFLKDFN